jgi:hypothetical protein
MQKVWRYIALGCVALFLASVATFYHPGLGFTALLGLPAGSDGKTPTLQAIRYFEYPAWASYDGQFYVQRAFDPLIRDPAVDRAMDLAPFRARRILFSWTAFLLGFGRPAWIVNVYALQNVACWLLLAALLTRWMPLTSVRGTACWAACLFSHGLLWSVRFSLLVRREYLAPWWRVGAAYAGLMLLLDPVLANPLTGAITRVLLPLTVSFNVLIAGERRPAHFWTWWVAGNLHVLSALTVMPLKPW